jgi:hypothetical protein
MVTRVPDKRKIRKSGKRSFGLVKTVWKTPIGLYVGAYSLETSIEGLVLRIAFSSGFWFVVHHVQIVWMR